MRSRGSAVFALLELPQRRSRAGLAWSLVLHAAGTSLLVIFGNRIVAPIVKHGPLVLVFVPPPADTPEPPPLPKPRILHRIFIPPKREVPALKLPEPVIRPPEMPVIKAEAPPVHLPPVAVPKPAPADTARFEAKLPAVEPAKPSAPVRVGGFEGSAVQTERSRHEPPTTVGEFGTAPVKSGPVTAALHLPVGNSGFQSATAVPAGPIDGHAVSIQSAGFGAVRVETGSSTRGAVARSGFGSAETVSGPAPNRPAQAQAGTFGDVKATTAPRAAVRTEPAKAPPAAIEILAKPKPVYPEEARQLRIEGEVILEVTFMAEGEVRVLRVVRGLGHGLDEAAIAASRAIKYRPAQRDGKAVDSTGTIRIQFELAY
jgi:TonB family protein